MMLPWNHIETFFYILLVVLIAYKPPKAWGGIGDFVERHYGDSFGFVILALGIGLVLASDVWTQLHDIGRVGDSLILAGFTALKLRPNPPNGNGGAPVTGALVLTKKS